MEELPNEILLMIISLIPPEYHPFLRQISKRWEGLLEKKKVSYPSYIEALVRDGCWFPRRGTTPNIMSIIAKYDRVDYFEILKKKGRFPLPFDAFLTAVKEKKIKALKWLLEHRSSYCGLKSLIDDSLLVNAAYSGDLEIVKFLIKVVKVNLTLWATTSAAAGGHLGILRYFYLKSAPMAADPRFNNICYAAAIYADSVECLEFLDNAAVSSGMKTLIGITNPDDDVLIPKVFYHDYFKDLPDSIEEQVVWAIDNNSLKVLTYLVSKGYSLDFYTCLDRCVRKGKRECYDCVAAFCPEETFCDFFRIVDNLRFYLDVEKFVMLRAWGIIEIIGEIIYKDAKITELPRSKEGNRRFLFDYR